MARRRRWPARRREAGSARPAGSRPTSRWLPLHERALAALEQTLDEHDRAEGARIRWASGTAGRTQRSADGRFDSGRQCLPAVRCGFRGGVTDDGEGHGRAVHERVRDAAEYGAGEGAHTARTDHQQVRSERAGRFGDDIDDIAVTCVGRRVDAGLAGVLGCAFGDVLRAVRLLGLNRAARCRRIPPDVAAEQIAPRVRRPCRVPVGSRPRSACAAGSLPSVATRMVFIAFSSGSPVASDRRKYAWRSVMRRRRYLSPAGPGSRFAASAETAYLWRWVAIRLRMSSRLARRSARMSRFTTRRGILSR